MHPASQIATRSTDNGAYAFGGNVNVPRAYSLNGLNQYTNTGPASLSHDANGNLTGNGTNLYTYDIKNRLVCVSGAHCHIRP